MDEKIYNTSAAELNSISDVDQSIYRNNHKLTADKIIQILDTVRDEASKSRRRWIWELMQNAKDVPNKFEQVNIQIELRDLELKFSHNGNPFTIDNITGLIQQVSSKPSDSTDVNTTGKFGTGFITTHLLSDIIHVRGVVKRPGDKFRRFTIELDRSGKTSEQLLPSIEEAIENIRKIDTNPEFPLVIEYEKKRKVVDLDSSFTYPLIDESSQNAAQAGLTDLIFTLPVTMINLPKIGGVRILNETKQSEINYSCSKISEDDHLKKYEVTISEIGSSPILKKYFTWETDDIKLICEVDNWTDLNLVDNFKKQPFLYRDFPLIGTENFHFPFVLNGISFFPTDKRDSILINENTDKPSHNRKLIDLAIDAAILFTDKLIEKGCRNLYLLANSELPDLDMEDATQQWYLKNQRRWRAELLKRKLMETENEISILEESYIPEMEISEMDNSTFWNLIGEFIGFNRLPKRQINFEWYKIINSGSILEQDTWGANLLLTKDELLGQVEDTLNLETLCKHLNQPEAFTWLNKLYNHLTELKILERLNSFKIVPNQYGAFNHLKPLFKESDSSKIPNEILDVLKELGPDWRNDMIHRKVIFADLNHTERGLVQASEEINQFLKKETKNNNIVTYDFLKHAKARQILISILQLTTKESRATSFRSKLFELCKEIYHIQDDFVEVESLEGFNFEIAIKLVIRMINNTITESKNIEAFSKVLGKEKDSTIIWLDNYLRFIAGSAEYKHLLEYGNIIPNRYNDFCPYESLNNFGTVEQPLDEVLIEILKDLDGKLDWNIILVADGISVFVKRTKTFDELGATIMMQVAQINSNDNHENYRKPLISLIEWCQKNSRLASHYLSDFNTKKNRMFFILTMEKSTIGGEMINLLKNQERFKLLIEISNSNVSLKDLQELVNISNRIGKISDILEFAKNLEEDDADYKFKLAQGKRIEDAFAKAIELEGLNATVEYQGIGSHDFRITNPKTGAIFFIELKSFSGSGLLQPIRMSMSQVQLAESVNENFALCVIERPHQYIDVTAEHIKHNLKRVTNYDSKIKQALMDYQSFRTISSRSDDISLEFFKTECKLKIQHTFINNNSNSFHDLIIRIKERLLID
jgi:hypothetical protein